MALWAKTQQLPSEIFQQVSALYAADLFPIEVRHYLAQWLEEQNWNDIDEENVAFSQDAQAFVEQLIGKLNEVGSNLDFVQQIQFQKYADGFRRFLSSPLDLVRVVKHCLNTEIRFIQQAETGNVVASVERNSHLWIAQKLDEVKRKAQQTTLDLRNLEQAQETFWLKFNEFNRMNAIFSAQMAQATTDAMKQDVQKKLGVQKDKLGNTINGIIAELVGGRMRLAECYKEIVMNLTAVQSQVLDVDLIQWKREQQLAGNGAMFNNNLEVIQQWCEGLADSIWNTRQQIKELERLINKASLPGGEEGAKLVSELRAQITQLLSSLVTSTFVIEKQPPQVMKTNTRFTAVVRLLVGGKLNVHMTSPQVKVNILSDAQANALLRSDQAAKYESSGEILNNTGAMEYIAATRQLVVNFRNMQLRKIRRAEKKGTESVMDEKFSLLFLSEFSIGSGELEFQVWTLSLPVVVIVHGNQEPHAWATVSWDNAFAESGRPCFQVPERVPWPQVADMLNTKFMSSCERPLTEDNIKFLAGKAFRNHNVADYSQLMLNWTAFAKEPLPDRNFTFWEWYYGILKLTREHLKNLWKDGLIMGFVGKVQAQDMLMKQSMGNFLLRFSDSELGGISIAAFKAETAGGGPGVDHLQPWTSKDFGIRSLADRIHDLGNLLFLYPDLPKDRAFQKYYTPPAEAQPTSTGYVKPELVTRVPGWSEGGLSEAGSYPSTPYNNYPQSPPDLTRDTPSSFSEPAGFPLEALEGFEWLDEASIPQDFNMDFNSLNLGQLQPNAVLDPSQFSFTTDQIQFP